MSNVASARFGDVEKSRFLGKTFGWMALALLVSAVSSFFTATNLGLMRLLWGNRGMGFWILVIGEIALVWRLTASIRKISPAAAIIGFLVYAVVNGMTLSTIFWRYNWLSIATAFVVSALTFMVMSFYGLTTKRNLMAWGRYIFMAMMGIIIATVVQVVISKISGANLRMFDLLISVVCVMVFTGLTAYDAQKLVRTAANYRDNDDFKKVSVLAALELYLDFINLFLAVLRLFGRDKE